MRSYNSHSTKVGGCNQQETLLSNAKLLDGSDGHEEDEDEDVDFNPFLRETPSPEASSSLSSENEGVVGANVVDNVGNSSSACRETNLSSNLMNEVHDHNQRDIENDDEEVVMQSGISPQGVESKDALIGRSRTRELMRENTPSSGNHVNEGELTDPINSTKRIMELDNDDAICKRTRARYSLANFSLDELETFLQETDDDDDLPNVDDEQEYRKFLAAVLQGGDNEGESIRESENVYDEDEDNDADFEIEIEEALDSDLDESMRNKERKKKHRGEVRRPHTRQNKHQKTSVQNKKKFLGQANRPLRPLLPLASNAKMPPFAGLDWQKSFPESSLHCPSSSSQAGLVNGFTPHQIGQLHCLIHEHTQLLVQVFSLSVLDPSRQHIAGETRRLISELVHTREKALSWRKVPYPNHCFHPPHIHPSVSDHTLHFSVDSSSETGPQKEFLDMMPVSHNTSPFEGRSNDGGHVHNFQTTQNSLWVPRVSGPVLSILDVAPLNLVKSYMADVSKAVREYQQRHVEALFENQFVKEPLFSVPNISSSPEAKSEALRRAISQGPNTVQSSLNVHQQPKKTLAATLVESTKKQSIAVAPKEIVKLALSFYPLFNSALYPRKPPPAAVANRVLFTDSEDELLAMGLMEYNTDWKEIQQRFLPCKSKHQIFVRQKNRCSSKAPENPIKAVRRLKTSPLTAEEKARIHEGLRVLKLDWMSVWKLIVPYRDPSLLPRQWRVALGTQKSYKLDAAKREKRRLYETQRRRCKAAASADWQTASEKEDYLVNNAAEGNKSGNDNMGDEDEAYVHEAFLADWRPGSSRFTSSGLPLSSLNGSDLQLGIVLPREDSCVSDIRAGDCSDCLSKSSKSLVSMRPQRVCRRDDPRLVKLAPDLPPVNLPPSVRVISQSAFKSYNCVASHSTKSSISGAEIENLVPRLADVVKSGTEISVNTGKNRSTPSSRSTINLCPRDPRLHSDQFLTEKNGAESDLQMHPLLLQVPRDGNLPYCQVNSSISASNTFNFIAGNQLQANFNHFSKPSHGSKDDGFYTSLQSKENPSNSCTIDFHPLLQNKDNLYNDTVTISADHIPVELESFQGNFSQIQSSSNSVITEPRVTCELPSTMVKPASPYEKANELDLEIHLSSTSRKEKVMTDRKKTEHSLNGSRVVLQDGGNIKESQKLSSSSQEKSRSRPTASMVASSRNRGHILDDHALVLSSSINRFTVDNVADKSLPEIVMEQEELSDSEEEIGEDVEFECEEMDDSEREQSDCEQLVSIEEVPSVIVEEERIISGDRKDRRCEVTTKSSGRSRKLGSTRKAKDASSCSLQLSLDLSVSQLKSKHEENGNKDDQAGKSLSSRPNRSCKKMM